MSGGAAPDQTADWSEAKEGSSGNPNLSDSEPNLKDITFGVLGPKLFPRGLSVIPLHHKRPITEKWGERRPTEAEVNHWTVDYPTANVGLLCGYDDIVAIDLDILDPKVSGETQRALDYLYDSPRRDGLYPKSMRFFRIPDLKGKLMSAAYDHNPEPLAKGEKRKFSRVEIMSVGQQVVISGIHPDTGLPYTGLDYDTLSLESFPIGSPEDIFDLLDLFETKAEKAGWRKVAERPAGSRRPGRGTSAGEQSGDGPDDFTKLRTEHRGTTIVDDFDLRGAPLFKEEMLELGWTFKGTGSFQLPYEGATYPVKTWLCKHPETDKPVSASVFRNPVNGLWYLTNWSSSVDLDTKSNHKFSHVLAVLKFGGDYSQLIAWLREKGFRGSDERSAQDDFADFATGAEGGQPGSGQQTGKKRRGFRLRALDEVLGQTVGVDWLVESLLPRGALASIFGPAGTCKTFIALSLALCTATGRDWCGRPVKQGPVVIVAGEGHAGIGLRIRAWLGHNNVSGEGLPLFISDSAVSIDEDAGAKALATAVDAVTAKHGPPALVIIDTRARCLNGDENEAAAVGKFIRHLDESLPPETTKLVIHHSGHGTKERSRGSSAWIGALDTEFVIDRTDDGRITMKCSKQKDAEMPPPMAFKTETVVVDADLNESIILEQVDGPTGASTWRPSPAMVSALQLLRELSTNGQGVDRVVWRNRCIKAGFYSSIKAFDNGFAKMLQRKAIHTDGIRVFVVDAEKGNG